MVSLLAACGLLAGSFGVLARIPVYFSLSTLPNGDDFIVFCAFLV